ncbi:hypothetical protein FJV76_25005 [Mesorhizobium sp. WSM4303]|uniref:hypothetical protein n=2 Tax=unclassified Mesorhizobium TaxID=325217 RepID=UPI00115DF099|nr:hypothetical protein [Mesorhizobium sp. WSM4303]TRC99049.1 hypothetical protein FJV76_25005 [Mesorhizobium sp. WSM4303]
MTTGACLSAVLDWLGGELNLNVRASRVLVIDGRLWIELSGLHDPDEPDVDQYAHARGVLWSRPIVDETTALTKDVILLVLHVGNPTPRIDLGPNYSSTSTPLPWQTLALVPTTDGVEGRSVSWVRERWGETMTWPFDG